jgi:hypothetical protein
LENELHLQKVENQLHLQKVKVENEVHLQKMENKFLKAELERRDALNDRRRPPPLFPSAVRQLSHWMRRLKR